MIFRRLRVGPYEIVAASDIPIVSGPLFDKYRTDSEFVDLLRKAGFEVRQ